MRISDWSSDVCSSDLRDALLVGDRAEIFLDSGEAKVENAEYVVHSGKVRGSAQYAKREETAIIRLKDGTYTSCEPGENSWHLQGNNVTLNPATGFGRSEEHTSELQSLMRISSAVLCL